MGVETEKRYDVKYLIVVQCPMELKDTSCCLAGDWARSRSCRVLQISVCTNSPRRSHCDIHDQSIHESLRNCHCCCRIHSPLGIHTTLIFFILHPLLFLFQSEIIYRIIYWTPQLPRGTHQWSSFLTPEELVLILQRAGINVGEMHS